MRFAKRVLPILAGIAGLWAQIGETPIAILPFSIEAGSSAVTIQVTGNGFQPDWQVLWNGVPRQTTWLSQYRLAVSLLDTDTAVPSLSFISVVDSAGQQVRAPAALWVYVAIANNDFRYDAVRNRLWVAVPASGGASANGIAVLDPASGTVESFISTSAEPQRLCLTDDSSFLYVATPGRILRLNTNTLAFDLDFPIPPTPSGALPPQTYAMTTPPGQPDLLVVSLQGPGASPGYMGSILFMRGVPLPNQLPVREGPQELPGWTPSGQLIGSNPSALYWIDVTSDGLKINRTISILLGTGCKYRAGLLYCGLGAVVDPVKGSYVGSYAAKGYLALLPDIDRIAFIDAGLQGPSGAILGTLTILRLSTGEPVFSGTVPFQVGSLFGPLAAWGTDGLVWRDAGFNAFNTPATRLYIFHAW